MMKTAEKDEYALPVKGIEVGLLWSLPFNAQIRDVIYDYIDYIKGFEDKIIDSWPIQRLRYILQLQTAHFVYPSATHTRFNHSLGVMYFSYKYLNQLLRTIDAESASTNKQLNELLKHAREASIAVRILGLLHDIGHGPFSHAFDQYVLKNPEYLGYRFGNHEVMGYLIYRDYLRGLIEKALREYNDVLGIDVEYILDLLDEAMKPPTNMINYTDLVSKGILGPEDFFAPRPENAVHTIVRLIVRDYVYTSDIIDYLKRDSYYTKLPLGNINEEWLIRNTYLVNYHSLLIPAISSKAIDDLVRLLNARKMMYKNVYLHHVNLAFSETIGVLLKCIKPYISNIINKMVEEGRLDLYMSLTDNSIYGLLQMIKTWGDIGNLCPDCRELARQSLENLFIYRKPAWKKLDVFPVNMNTAKHIFSRRFGDTLQREIKKAIKREIAYGLKSKGFTEEDVNVVITSINIFPSAAKEIVKEILIVRLKDDKPISWDEVSLDKFAAKYGLIPEALFIVYLNRAKYHQLTESELNKARDIVKEVLRDAIGGELREAPETS